MQYNKESYDKFLSEGLENIFKKFFPVSDANESKFTVEYVSHKLVMPKYSPTECKRRFSDYAATLILTLCFLNKKLGKKTKRRIVFWEYSNYDRQ